MYTQKGDFKVNFLHRNVHDFLETRNIRKVLIERASTDFDVDRYLYNTISSQIKHTKVGHSCHEDNLDALLEDFSFHLSKRELKRRCEDAATIHESE